MFAIDLLVEAFSCQSGLIHRFDTNLDEMFLYSETLSASIFWRRKIGCPFLPGSTSLEYEVTCRHWPVSFLCGFQPSTHRCSRTGHVQARALGQPRAQTSNRPEFLGGESRKSALRQPLYLWDELNGTRL